MPAGVSHPATPTLASGMTMNPKPRVRGPGGAISSIDSWFAAARPKGGDLQWTDHHSAKELARAWCPPTGSPRIPVEVAEVLDADPATAGFRPWLILPEHTTPLDEFRGEPRNHDLVAVGLGGGAAMLLAVEGKARETFDKVISDRLIDVKPGSKVPERLNGMSRLLFDKEIVGPGNQLLDPGLGALHYQLLTAAAGTLIESRRRFCPRAVLLIHEFAPSTPTGDWATALETNADALDRFTTALLGTPTSVKPGTMTPAVSRHVTGPNPGPVELRIAKVRTPL